MSKTLRMTFASCLPEFIYLNRTLACDEDHFWEASVVMALKEVKELLKE